MFFIVLNGLFGQAKIITEGGTSRETCARHVRRAISLASFNLEGYKLAWANPCPNPGHTPICSQIGKEMPEKSLVNWKFSNFLSFPSLCHIQPISAIFCPKEDSPRQLSHVGCTNIQAAQAIVSREVHTTVPLGEKVSFPGAACNSKENANARAGARLVDRPFLFTPDLM